MAAPIAEPYESLSDFKYYFLNAPNKEVALNEFWLKVNPNWSFWKITYNKDEGIIIVQLRRRKSCFPDTQSFEWLSAIS
jgi:hypothetical protein